MNSYIAAYGGTPFTQKDIAVESLAQDSVAEMLRNFDGISRKDIDAVIVSTNSNSEYLASIVSDICGLEPSISHTVENMCASGAAAAASAVSYVESGMARCALVIGAERHDSPGRVLDWDESRGAYSSPVHWASIFTEIYRRRHGVDAEALAVIAAKNHRQALKNPEAGVGADYTISDILDSKNIAENLHLLECSMPCSGASAMLVCSRDAASCITDSPVAVRAIGSKTMGARFLGERDIASMRATREAAAAAFAASGWDARKLDVLEVHDAFSVCEAITLEAIGAAEPGTGAAFCRRLYETGNTMVNPRGGLIGAGHPLGATGIAQIVEVARQLRGDAGGRQVDGATRGLAHNMAAAGTSASVVLLES